MRENNKINLAFHFFVLVFCFLPLAAFSISPEGKASLEALRSKLKREKMADVSQEMVLNASAVSEIFNSIRKPAVAEIKIATDLKELEKFADKVKAKPLEPLISGPFPLPQEVAKENTILAEAPERLPEFESNTPRNVYHSRSESVDMGKRSGSAWPGIFQILFWVCLISFLAILKYEFLELRERSRYRSFISVFGEAFFTSIKVFFKLLIQILDFSIPIINELLMGLAMFLDLMAKIIGDAAHILIILFFACLSPGIALFFFALSCLEKLNSGRLFKTTRKSGSRRRRW